LDISVCYSLRRPFFLFSFFPQQVHGQRGGEKIHQRKRKKTWVGQSNKKSLLQLIQCNKNLRSTRSKPNEWLDPLNSSFAGQERSRLKQQFVGTVQRQICLKHHLLQQEANLISIARRGSLVVTELKPPNRSIAVMSSVGGT
jgi:hypothetical protein